MRPAGEVVRVAQSLAVVRTFDETHPDVGANVVDEDLETVGDVVDVFGPVERPYVAVSPGDDRPLAALVGSRVYERDD